MGHLRLQIRGARLTGSRRTARLILLVPIVIMTILGISNVVTHGAPSRRS